MSEIIRNREIIRTLELPYPGEVFVDKGERVNPDTLIAKTELLDIQPGYFDISDFFDKEFTIDDVKEVIKVKIGDFVKRGDTLAEYNGKKYIAPYYGLVEHVSESGQYILVRQKVSKDEEPLIINATEVLDISPRAVMHTMQVKVGQEVFRSQSLVGDVKMVYSPMSGIIEDIIEDEGKIVIKPYYNPKKLYANIYGTVKETDKKRTISILTKVDIIKGSFGIGKEVSGILKTINEEFEKDSIIFTESKLTKQDIAKAIKNEVTGIVAPSADADDLIDIFGDEMYKGVTGVESSPVAVILTEGFGDKVMLSEAVDVLKENLNENITINPKTNLQTPRKLPEIYTYIK